MINMKRYAGEKTPYELFSEAVDRKDKNSADTIALNANKWLPALSYSMTLLKTSETSILQE